LSGICVRYLVFLAARKDNANMPLNPRNPALAAWYTRRYLTGTHMSLRSCAHQ